MVAVAGSVTWGQLPNESLGWQLEVAYVVKTKKDLVLLLITLEVVKNPIKNSARGKTKFILFVMLNDIKCFL